MAQYPVALDASTDPLTPVTESGDSLPGPHLTRRAIIALETKLGIGASVAASGEVLVGDGTGSSDWIAASTITEIAALIAKQGGGTSAPADGEVLVGDGAGTSAWLAAASITEIAALLAKVGTGVTAPVSGDVLVGDGAGSSAWVASSSLIVKATVALDEAALDDLHNTPITLVADPGDGFVVVVHRVLWDYDFDTGAYTAASGTPVIEITDGTNVFAQYTIVAVAADQVFMDSPTSAIVLPSEAIVAEVNSGALQDGAGGIAITVFYTVEAV